MRIPSSYTPSDFDTHFKVFHELMSIKVLEILLVASAYDAYILEEDGSLASKIINEYSGLNLSRPPRIIRAPSAAAAIGMLSHNHFDLVITMPHLEDMDSYTLGLTIKGLNPKLPVILLAHTARSLQPVVEERDTSGIDRVFIWSGDADLLLAVVKSVEDRLNVAADTRRAKVRVLLLVEDSPLYTSYLLPLIYKEVVNQIQAVLEESLNEEHRLLKMRARPKILVAETYEDALDLFHQYRQYFFGVISDTRFPKAGRMTEDAGVTLLTLIKQEIPDLPLLLMSTEPHNRDKARSMQVEFLDKNSPNLQSGIHDFFLNFLGFGDFVFRTPDGREVGRASNLRTLEEILPTIPDEPLCYHAVRNRFSNWIMARSEIALATRLREVQVNDFPDVASMRSFIINSLYALRKWRQRGVVAQFKSQTYDPEISDFIKIGNGSLGGKARGLAFASQLLRHAPEFFRKYQNINILVPKTLVITTEGFDAFVKTNNLEFLTKSGFSDEVIARHFIDARLPPWLKKALRVFLRKFKMPLSVRSSSLLEDAHYHPFAGLYKTYMIPNNHPEFSVRLKQLVMAVKLVWASTYFKEPRNFSNSTAFRFRKESMAVIVQQIAGRRRQDYFYPDVSGIAQSRNYYPIGRLKPEDGVASIALGFGQAVSDAESALRFCPRYPKILPQFSKLEDILNNAQRRFYALKMTGSPDALYFERGVNLQARQVDESWDEFPVRFLSSTYVADEQRIRDGDGFQGPRIVTFANILKYDRFPLSRLLVDLLDLGRAGLGCPVEFEFSVNIDDDPTGQGEFFILQMRPMSAGEAHLEVEITKRDIEKAFCYSNQAMGHGKKDHIQDMVYVKPEAFDAGATIQIAQEIAQCNVRLSQAGRECLLIGPGRWGTFDRWLGIPVKWQDISAAGAIIELRNTQLRADPSHGSHFFQKITTRGLPYITITEGEKDIIDWQRIAAFPVVAETPHLRHVRPANPFTIKCDGRSSRCVIYEEE